MFFLPVKRLWAPNDIRDVHAKMVGPYAARTSNEEDFFSSVLQDYRVRLGIQTAELDNAMTQSKARLAEILEDIRSGMDETAIRKKYNLSHKTLEDLYEKLIQSKLLEHDPRPLQRRLNIAAILADVRAGMSSSDLMNKYKLSQEMLRRVSRKILDARGKRSAGDGPETVIEERPEFLATREFVRYEVDFKLPVYDASRPETHGMVRDVSEEGLSVTGIEADVGDVKTLVILGDELGQFSPFEFEGYCRWRFADPADGTCLTGFAINKISENDLQQLQLLVRLVMTGG